MKPPSSIASLYIDFDAFFANVEKQIDPAIRMRPLGVTALGSEYSALITCCYMAKRAGVKRGMRVHEARDICSDLVIRIARPDIYVEYNRRIAAEINKYVPIKKIWSIDEMECALIGREQQRAQDIAFSIQDGLRRNIGPFITPSIGLAPNQFLAKVAAEMEKPNGFVTLRAEDLPGPLLKLALTDLPGISVNMERRLNAAGIQSVKDFWEISAKHARAIWRSVEGERMWAQLHGYPIERPPTRRAMFGHSRVLSGEFKHPDKAVECLRLLTVKAANRLRRAEMRASGLALSFKVQPKGQARKYRWSEKIEFNPRRDDLSFLNHMHRLYEKGCQETKPWRILQVSVILFNLSTSDMVSRDLFEDQKCQNWEHLSDIMDKFNRDNGRAYIHIGPRPKIPGGYAGAKIAFGRIPDKEDFL